MENVFFFHGVTKDNRRFTIAGQYVRKGIRGLLFGKKALLLGAALCSKNDAFIKKVGRAKAVGRMLSNKKGNISVNIDNKDLTTKSFLDYASSFNLFKSKVLVKQFNLHKK